MELRPFGRARVPVVGQGTWQMEGDDRKRAVAAIRRAIELGMTHVDTAELYGRGKVEEMVAEAIAGVRDRVFLVSKVLPSNASYEGTLRACENSLRRLRTDWLDAYLLHWPGPHPLEETFRAFEELVARGKIRAFGVSNFDVDELEEAQRLAPGKIACNQVLYHLGERAIEHRVVPWCETHGVAVVGYSPFGSTNGFPSPSSRGGRVLADIARARGATPRRIALAFLVRRPSLLTIPKASRVAHVEDNACAADLTLDEDEIARIEQAFPLGEDRGALPTL